MEHPTSNFFNLDGGNEFFPAEMNLDPLLGSPWGSAAVVRLLTQESVKDWEEQFADLEIGSEEPSNRIALASRPPFLSAEIQGSDNSAIISQTTKEALDKDSGVVLQAGTTYTPESSVAIATAASATFALADLDGISGFTIQGLDSGDKLGRSVSHAGDINGDGIDDFIVGAPEADPSNRAEAGKSYVINSTSLPLMALTAL